MKVTVRSLQGNVEVELDGDNVTAEQVRDAAGIASGQTLRSGGARLESDSPVSDGSVIVATPPEAKHGNA